MNIEEVQSLAVRVAIIRREAEALAQCSSTLPAVWRNALRILANVRMLELNFESDASMIQDQKPGCRNNP